MTSDEIQGTIRCPHCGEEIAIDETIADRLIAAVGASGAGRLAHLEDENAKLKAQLDRLSNDLDLAQRRTRTGSATEEGYARQDRVLSELQRRFPEDDILPVKRGVRGADIMQRVRRGGTEFGTILWEIKTATKWGKEWPGKLGKDQEEAGAAVAVIVCDSLPDGIDTLGQHGSIWVATFGCAMDLALMLRMLIVNTYRYEVAASNKATSAEKVFDYVLTGAFGARVDQIATMATKMMRELSREKREFEFRWKRMEGQITELLQVRDAIGFDLIDAVGSDVELPSAFCAKLPGEDETSEFLLLPGLVDSPLELPRNGANEFPSPSSAHARIPHGPRSKRPSRAEEGG
jgi:Uncharacterized protein conserved in bacteria (DUF2130)